MAKKPDIQGLREAIEAIDREILDGLKRRMELVDRIGEAKLAAAAAFRDQQREEKVLQRVRHFAVEMGLDPHAIERLYRGVMEMSIARQQAGLVGRDTAPLRVAYQGVEGSYSQLAARQRYGERPGGALLEGHDDLRRVVEAVQAGDADLGLMPIENTTAGSINETYDLLAEADLTITGEMVSQVEHCLLGLPGAKIDAIRVVLSHPAALKQCEAFVRTLPKAITQAEFDTAGSARKCRDAGDRSAAAIASESAARAFGLQVLARGIQDQANNFTRFVEVARHAAPTPPEVACKTSLLLSLAHRPGALGEILGHFGRRGVNLTKLESRPIPEAPFRHRFYLDIEGHASSEAVAAAIEAVRPHTHELRVLGSYPLAAQTPSA